MASLREVLESGGELDYGTHSPHSGVHYLRR
jgi:hypothetical protein